VSKIVIDLSHDFDNDGKKLALEIWRL